MRPVATVLGVVVVVLAQRQMVRRTVQLPMRLGLERRRMVTHARR